jgi:imidazolonepropionase-like amidohydrolase
MPFRAALGCFLAVAVSLLVTAETHETPALDPTLVISDVSVIPVDTNEVLSHRAVVIRNGVVAAIVPTSSAEIPADATVVDGTGKFLIPGLVDSHAHITPLDARISNGDRALVRLRDQAGPPYPYDSRVLRGFVAAGVTTVIHMGGGGDTVLRLRDLTAAGKIVGPRLIVGKLIDGPAEAVLPALNKTPPASSMAHPTTAADGRAAVLDAKTAGYDFIKAYQHLNRATYDAIVGTARSQGMPVWGHLPELGCPDCVDIGHPFEVPMDNIAHAEELGRYAMQSGFDPGQLFFLAGLVRKSGMALTPTLITSRTIAALYRDRELHLPPQEVLRYVDPLTLRSWQPARVRYLSDSFRQQPDIDKYPAEIDFSRVLVRLLWRQGVVLTVGTDAPTVPGLTCGFSVWTEMRELRAIGLSPLEVLRAATVNAHHLMRDPDGAGVVRVGSPADLLLLDGNPLEDISNVEHLRGVILKGRWLSAADIERAMDDNLSYYQRIDRLLGLHANRGG